MLTPRSRRLVRFAIYSTTATLLLASSYISSYFGMWWLTGRGAITINTNLQLQQTLYSPVLHYIVAAGPGSESVNKLSIWFSSLGRGSPLPWNAIDGKIGVPRAATSPNAPQTK